MFNEKIRKAGKDVEYRAYLAKQNTLLGNLISNIYWDLNEAMIKQMHYHLIGLTHKGGSGSTLSRYLLRIKKEIMKDREYQNYVTGKHKYFQDFKKYLIREIKNLIADESDKLKKALKTLSPEKKNLAQWSKSEHNKAVKIIKKSVMDQINKLKKIHNEMYDEYSMEISEGRKKFDNIDEIREKIEKINKNWQRDLNRRCTYRAIR